MSDYRSLSDGVRLATKDVRLVNNSAGNGWGGVGADSVPKLLYPEEDVPQR